MVAARADSRVVRGWLITAQTIFVKHSVVRTADDTLLDITPRVKSDAQHPIDFIVWACVSEEEFARLPP